MYIKIYFNNKPLFLCDAVDKDIEPFMHHDDAVFIDEFSTHTIKTMIHEMQQQKVHAGVFLHKNLEELRKAFWKKFMLIQAAGGVAFNKDNKVLMIFRKGKWDLPKGKLDDGEDLATCAIREIKEETGLQEVSLDKPLITTYHVYDESGHHILKETHWFLMHSTSANELKPQQEEDITEARWMGKEDEAIYKANTYALVMDVLKAAQKN